MATVSPAVESKKQEIAELWGIPISDITQKLSSLSSIINNVSDIILLDYLKKCDLNIESAINYHFSRSLSPSPSPSHNTTNNNNHNNNNNGISMNTSNDSNLFEFTINEIVLIYRQNLLYKSKVLDRKLTQNGYIYNVDCDGQIEWLQTDKILPFTLQNMKLMKKLKKDTLKLHLPIKNEQKSNDSVQVQEMDIDDNDNNDNNNNQNKPNKTNKPNKRRSQRQKNIISHKYKSFKLSDDDSQDNIYADEESEEYIPAQSQPNNKSKKRKHVQSSNPTNTNQPQTKRRKIRQIATNANSSMKAERDTEEESDNIQPEIEEKRANVLPKLPVNHLTWKRLSFGTITIKYSVRNGAKINSIHDLWWQSDGGISIQYPSEHAWFGSDAEQIKQFYGHIISQMNNQGTYIKVRVNSTTLLGLEDKTATVDVSEVVMPFSQKHTRSFWGFGSEDAAINNTTAGLYESVFEIYVTRQIETDGMDAVLAQHDSFDISMSKAIAFCCDNRAIYDDYMETTQLVADYKHAGYDWTLPNLLDYACKYKFEAYSSIKQCKYGISVALYPYQCQSIEWMLAEENDAVGFYRHFYKFGECDSGFFYISKVFGEIVVNKHLPSVHGGFLCEEMGLGKTVEMLSLITCNKRQYFNAELEVSCSEMVENEEYKYYKSAATLIIAPVSLVGQWEKETAEKCGKTLKVVRYYGSNRKRAAAFYLNCDIVYTTYGILGKEKGDNRSKHILHCIEWFRIILDESHYIKNGASECSKNINKLRGINKWLLTGTPFGTKLFDIHNQLKFLGFTAAHLSQIDVGKVSSRNFNPKARGWKNETDCVAMLKIMKYLVMRHRKSQKFNDEEIVWLPEKEENVIFVAFASEQQRKYYNKLYATAKERYSIYASTGNIGRGSISILSSLTWCRRACSGHIYKTEEIEEELCAAQTRTLRVREMVNDWRNKNKSAQELFELAHFEAYNVADAECPICYETPLDDPLQTVCRHIFCAECIKAILSEKAECPMCREKCGMKELRKPPKEKGKEREKEETKKEEIIESGDDDEMIKFDSKLIRLMCELKKLSTEKASDKSLIFTSFSSSLDWICCELEKNGFKYKTLTGSMTMNARKKALQSFADDGEIKVFVLTVRSGAVGITLTSANHVFMMEPQFNPALYLQAINRVYRLGQTKKVYIHTLIMKQSIEEKIWNINKKKINGNSNSNSIAVAGNIRNDSNSKLQTYEISQLFE